MGTRGLNVIILDGQIKVAQYNQWDSYPGGQGLTALKFLREVVLSSFKEKVQMCSWITPEEHQAYWVECGSDPGSNMVPVAVSDVFSERHYELSRDCGADIYELIQDSYVGLKLQDSYAFASDSLFCEWAYVVDLDLNRFEVYRGFNQEPLTPEDRFYPITDFSSSYHPVKLIQSYNLLELPTEEEFVAEFSESEDE